jgi:hypothetical protein
MVRVLEQGDIFFCYRPKIDVERAGGLADVQRFCLILKPGTTPVFARHGVGSASARTAPHRRMEVTGSRLTTHRHRLLGGVAGVK